MENRVEYWVKIPIGPIHPALEEPEKFIITLDGERIVNVDVKLGYNLRGLEWGHEKKLHPDTLPR